MEQRPTFLQWLKMTWPDLLTMVILGTIATTVFRAGPPMGSRSFTLTNPNLAYPLRTQIIPSTVAGVLGVCIPMAVMLLAQIRIQNFWDLNNGILGLVYAVICATTFQVMVKWLIGGFRPQFYEFCQPKIPPGASGAGFGGIMWNANICTVPKNNALYNAQQSFPSGHSTIITTGGVYLFLWLNAKMKVFANYHAPMWKLVLLFLPLLGAVLVCGTLTLDHTHHWWDILAGAFIGTIFAISAYRMVYRSVFDWRTNHIPLNRTSPSSEYSRPDLVLTRQAGWGDPDRDNEKEKLPGPVTSTGAMPGPVGEHNDKTASGSSKAQGA
ncbi:Uu.00g067780.m01.CDS01 [Anthostomella pinea]|uniref:Uu.00g067780.m01.CDS01 n=1 Tax=Anthostomella pinea TaxID=933095 RepID=A0AAI8VU77_9PEZI|nr:Uu.00g067780.m01.CDS01 [Anthostomella pinea]